MSRTALVLEGGGMRGVFTAGVLESFIKNNIYFTDVFAVSAGASTSVTYLARQEGRNKRVYLDYVNDHRYKGVRSFIKTGAYFNKKFLFDTIPNELDPFDYDSFFNRKENFYVALTNCETGETEFVSEINSKTELMYTLDAATSLPIISKPVKLNGKLYMDGGISCPIIIDEVMSKNFDKIVYVLTQPKGYRKNTKSKKLIYNIFLRKHPKLIEQMVKRNIEYNKKLDTLEALEKEGKITIIRPSDDFEVTRMESDLEKAKRGYEIGLVAGDVEI